MHIMIEIHFDENQQCSTMFGEFQWIQIELIKNVNVERESSPNVRRRLLNAHFNIQDKQNGRSSFLNNLKITN